MPYFFPIYKIISGNMATICIFDNSAKENSTADQSGLYPSPVRLSLNKLPSKRVVGIISVCPCIYVEYRIIGQV